MIEFEYPVDDPGSVRAAAALWRGARESIGTAGAAIRSSSAAVAASWQGVAATSAVAVLERTASRHDEGAGALDVAALVLDHYADAVEAARADIDRLNAEVLAAEAEYRSDLHRAEAVPAAETVVRSTRLREAAESHQAALAGLRAEYERVVDRLSTTAASLGDRLHAIAARAFPSLPDPNRGPARVVADNAGDRGEVDWVTHLALSHPRLTDEQRLWIMANRDQLNETLDILLAAAANPAVTDGMAANYLATMAHRNRTRYLANAFEDNRFEFMCAVLLPTVVSIITGREFRNQQRTDQLFSAIVDAATTGLPPSQLTSSLGQRPRAGVSRAVEYPEAPATAGLYTPDRPLPRARGGDAIPDVPDAPHTQLGRRGNDDHTYRQARTWEWDDRGRLMPTRDIDFTDHGRPQEHPNPHQHRLVPYNPNTSPRGGFDRGRPEPL